MNLNILSSHLDSYTLWLRSHQYQSNTIRNYLQDLKTYLVFSNNNISEDYISKYYEQVSPKTNSRRYLASISIFCQFLTDQHLTEVNIFKQVKKHINRQPHLSVDIVLTQYKDHLKKETKSILTIKNYLNDVHQYFDWLKSNEV